MDKRFREAFAALNQKQRQAVETIDGPVLVIAGPGTGKTQLISTRVGYILQNTDTPPDSLLLLTFTEAGVQAMKDRLSQMIGRAAYDIPISSYHAFGGEIFRRYPDYFEDANLSLVEELGADTLLRGIINKLPYSNPLKFADNYIEDVKSFISDCKRALLSPQDVETIANANLGFISTANQVCREPLSKILTVSAKTVPQFEELLTAFSSAAGPDLPGSVLPLLRYAQGELELALDYFQASKKTTLLTEWKRHWLAKDDQGNYILDGKNQNERLAAAAGIYDKYQKTLKKRQLYDYDDMILRAIEALQNNPELRYSLADRYSYIMLDEFQDTNAAQFRLVQLLTDHPVHEGRPNILAVGDDDQAIYAFQGADHANMVSFASHYRQVRIISLKDNYRSWPEILITAQNIAQQIQSRLVNQIDYVNKELSSANNSLPGPVHIEAIEFKSDASHYSWIADEIKSLIDKGMPAKEIAVLAPKHRYLSPLLPYLSELNLPVYYERRENILDEPIIRQLEQMSRLVLALADGDESQSNSLWPEVLSYDFWRIPTEKIWSTSWQTRESRQPWTTLVLNDEVISVWAQFFIKLSSLLPLSTLEQQLDALLGMPYTQEPLELPVKSPMYEYYFSTKTTAENPLKFSRLISSLNILRSRLREWRQSQGEPAGLKDFVDFIEGHRAAGINILNTSPYHETTEAVNLLTAYGSKGREFQAVFIAAATDEAWGSASRNQGYRLSLPANLSYIRYQGASEDERLRLLYVAATRAKTHLYITGFRQNLAGKAMNRLKYLEIEENDKGELISNILPKNYQEVKRDNLESLSIQVAQNYWTDRHTPPFTPQLNEVLESRLKSFHVSASDLNRFVNIVDYGPDAFFIKCLLYFPSATGVNDAFGTALHNTLRFCGNIFLKDQRLPSLARLTEIFDAQLGRIDLPADELSNLSGRGHASLKAWLTQKGKDLKLSDRFEYDFKNEGSRIGDAKLSGKVDRMIIDEKRRSITVVDYKTGRSYSRWQSNIVKLHMFAQQLQFYKLLIENSARFRKYKVERGIIQFVEPNENGKITDLELIFDQADLDKTLSLIQAVWHSVQTLQFPDISGYPKTLAGIRQFEDDLIKPRQNKSTGL